MNKGQERSNLVNKKISFSTDWIYKLFNWRARKESNLDLRLRRPTSYPLDHGRMLGGKEKQGLLYGRGMKKASRALNLKYFKQELNPDTELVIIKL
jgi:hypothetical protein